MPRGRPRRSRALAPAPIVARGRPGPLAVVVVVGLLVLGVVAPVARAAPVAAEDEGAVVGQGVTLASSASCRHGDVDITYEAGGRHRRSWAFSTARGDELDRASAWSPDGTVGVARLGARAPSPPPAGTLVAVRVAADPADPEDGPGAEFFVLYQCDERSTDGGGVNTVLGTCVGEAGTCPHDVQEAIAGGGTVEPTTAPPESMPLVVQPAFTG